MYSRPRSSRPKKGVLRESSIFSFPRPRLLTRSTPKKPLPSLWKHHFSQGAKWVGEETTQKRVEAQKLLFCPGQQLKKSSMPACFGGFHLSKEADDWMSFLWVWGERGGENKLCIIYFFGSPPLLQISPAEAPHLTLNKIFCCCSAMQHIRRWRRTGRWRKRGSNLSEMTFFFSPTLGEIVFD